MKSKYMIIPAVLLVLAVLCSVFLTVYASPFVYNAALHFFTKADVKPDLNKYNKVVRFGEKAYEISPNESTLYPLLNYYNPSVMMLLSCYGREEIPKDYFENGIKYKKTELDFAKAGKKNIAMGPYQALNINSVWYVMPDKTYVLDVWTQYITLLYLNGETDKAFSELDSAIEFYKPCSDRDAPVMIFRLPFNIMYAFAENDEQRDKVTAYELKITEWTKANRKLSEEYASRDNLYSNFTLEQLREGVGE
ncbi:MAG: hypothetical protein E7514_07015 [Ruminococcaceae bacterium]|nr:hypothetical protein [Oscillospiraceae bacterium]